MLAPQGLTTVTEAVPAPAMREAGTVAVSCVEETNAVVSPVPFQFTVEVETKLVPFTVKVNCWTACRRTGRVERTDGRRRSLIVKVTAFDGWPWSC